MLSYNLRGICIRVRALKRRKSILKGARLLYNAKHQCSGENAKSLGEAPDFNNAGKSS